MLQQAFLQTSPSLLPWLTCFPLRSILNDANDCDTRSCSRPSPSKIEGLLLLPFGVLFFPRTPVAAIFHFPVTHRLTTLNMSVANTAKQKSWHIIMIHDRKSTDRRRVHFHNGFYSWETEKEKGKQCLLFPFRPLHQEQR